jgi:hypothetical protein
MTIFNIYSKTSLSVDEYISEYSDKVFCNDSLLNLCFFITPHDCECLRYFSTKEFVGSVNNVKNDYNNSISINYIVSGNYCKEKCISYISEIKDEINYYIIENNEINEFILYRYGPYTTPFLIIVDNNNKVKYWRELNIRKNTVVETKNICKLLEVIK